MTGRFESPKVLTDDQKLRLDQINALFDQVEHTLGYLLVGSRCTAVAYTLLEQAHCMARKSVKRESFGEGAPVPKEKTMTQDEEKKEECPEGKPADECCGKPEDCTAKADDAAVAEAEETKVDADKDVEVPDAG